MAQHGDGYLVSLACADSRRFDCASSADHWQKHDELDRRRPRLSKAKFAEMEKTMGQSFNPHGLLSYRRLRECVAPADVHTYDPMHVIFAGGVLQEEVFLLLEAAKLHLRVGFKDVREYVQMWQWPRSEERRGWNAADLFSDSRATTSHATFKATASELVTVYAIVRLYVATVLSRNEAMQLHVASFVALCALVDAVLQCKRGVVTAGADVRALVGRFMSAFTRAYSEDACRPKHHFLFHLADQIERDGVLLDCWTHERKHQVVKAACNWTDNTAQFEASTLSRALAEQERQLPAMSFGDHLMEPTVPCVTDREASASRGLCFKGARVSSGSFYAIDGKACFVEACVQVDSDFFLLCDVHDLAQRLTPEAARWRPSGRMVLLPCSGNLSQPAACWLQEEHCVLVL